MAKSTFNHVKISGITAVVPERCINIDDEILFYGGDVKLLNRNKSILGLGKRHVVDEFTSFSDLGEAAAINLIDMMKLDRDAIDTLIVATTSHDYRGPATACIIQGRLGLSQDCTCYDQAGLGCTAYVHALLQAHALIESRAAEHVLVIAGDLTSTHSDSRNRNVNMLFGDAAVATLVEHAEEEKCSWFTTGTNGVKWKSIVCPAGGHALPIRADIACLEVTDADGNVWRICDDIMKGMSVFQFSTVAGPKCINDLLAMSGKSIDDIDYFAFHQANKQIVRTVANYAGLPKDKYSTQTFTEYANCSAASVATDVVREYSQRPPGVTMLTSFGIGLSWGAALVDLSSTKIGKMGTYITPFEKKIPRDKVIKEWIEYYRSGNE